MRLLKTTTLHLKKAQVCHWCEMAVSRSLKKMAHCSNFKQLQIFIFEDVLKKYHDGGACQNGFLHDFSKSVVNSQLLKTVSARNVASNVQHNSNTQTSIECWESKRYTFRTHLSIKVLSCQRILRLRKALRQPVVMLWMQPAQLQPVTASSTPPP